MAATLPMYETAEMFQDLRTLADFIELYCREKHAEESKTKVELKTLDVNMIAGHSLYLCPECQKLLGHAFTKRSHCPMHPKPACKDCPNHCYHPKYRAEIRQVMKYSGRRLVMSGRIDLLLHLLF
jgi:hypothetical protein